MAEFREKGASTATTERSTRSTARSASPSGSHEVDIPENMTVSAYARHRGVSRRAVYKALEWRIAKARMSDGRIATAQADRLWEANTHPGVGGKQRGKSTLCLTSDELVALCLRLKDDPEYVMPREESALLLVYCRAEAIRLDYEYKVGLLVEEDRLNREIFERARGARDALFAIPDRLAAELAGMTNGIAIRNRLRAEIEAALAELEKPLPCIAEAFERAQRAREAGESRTVQ
ncbi:MAG: hypothetical protein KGL48_14030 [Sphingomonadales bacterium]|nr:hypothetical protein [Sphingomonadales bacterium]